jgi:uncharacterized protein YecE (DUF72 family)
MLYVGTCGFSYKEWIGPFYPRGLDASSMFEYYARRFGAVEIDSTYYAIPAPALFERLDRRSPAAFRFSVKAPGSITHLPADGVPDETSADQFSAAIEPIRSTGKLGAVLAQFPHSFRPGKDAHRRLEWLRGCWPNLPLVAEFRHRDWQRAEALRRLRGLGIGWCNVDEPGYASLMRPSAEHTSDVGYVRFHGRNAQSWWKHREASERYSYLYSDSELSEWLPRIAEVEEKTTDTYVFFNNHRNGQATVNALQMAEMLDVLIPTALETPAGPEQQMLF